VVVVEASSKHPMTRAPALARRFGLHHIYVDTRTLSVALFIRLGINMSNNTRKGETRLLLLRERCIPGKVVILINCLVNI